MKKFVLFSLLSLTLAGCGMEGPVSTVASSRVILPMASIGEVNDLNALMDSDKNQKISLAEFKAAVNISGHPLAAYAKAPETLEMQSQKYIMALDQDQDGDLSFEEASGEALYTFYFEAQDLNKDGMLDQGEFKVYGDKLTDVETFKDKLIVNLMSHDKDFFLSEADENSDTKISQGEFLKFGMTPLGRAGSPYADNSASTP